MRNLVILFLILAHYCCFAIDQPNDSVVRYYELKNKAELAIIDSAYPQALRYYKQAFAYKPPNARDISNALILAYRQKDSATARSCFNLLVRHGHTREKMEEEAFGRSFKTQPLYQWVTAGYEQIRQEALQSNMPRVAAVLDSVFAADQGIRIDMENGVTSPEQSGALVAVDCQNVAFLKQYIAQHGFPGYEQAGNFETIRKGYTNAPGTIWLVMWHTRHVPPQLNEVVHKAVLDGRFPPDEYAMLMDSQNEQKVYYELFDKKISTDKQVSFEPVPDEEEVNRRRAALYLEPVAALRRKLQYDQKGGRLFSLLPAWVVALNFAPINNF